MKHSRHTEILGKEGFVVLAVHVAICRSPPELPVAAGAAAVMDRCALHRLKPRLRTLEAH